MKTLISNISSLVTVNSKGKNLKSGSEMQDIGEIKDAAILFDEKIIWLGTMSEWLKQAYQYDTKINANGKTVMPGFVDSHTHIVFAGDRSDEFAARLRGATYQDIAQSGGGIKKSVRETRNASIEQLVANAKKIALSALNHGTTTIEIKSGYGLSLESELKMLNTIDALSREIPLKIVTTFMGAHDFPSEYAGNHDAYVDLICDYMLPQVASAGLAEFCDAFVDKGYYTLEQGQKIFRRALDNGLKLKCHCDELADVGAASMAAKMGAISADHLLFVSEDGIADMKKSGTIASLLPGTAYFIRMPYARARTIIESGVPVCLATDCNPGSCMTENMQMIMSLAAINMNMTAEECISAATLNGAAALCRSESTGSLEIGKSADIILADIPGFEHLLYHFAVNHIESVWIDGSKVK